MGSSNFESPDEFREVMNRAFELMFGWTAGELIGRPIDRLVPSAFREAHARHRLGYFATPQPRLMAGLQLV